MRKLVLLILVCCAALFWQCGNKSQSNDAAYGLDQNDLPMPADPLFKTIPGSESGIDFQNTIEESFEFSVIKFAYLYNGGGVGVLDVNNDGLQDLYFISTTGACKLYLNKGGFKFQDITA